MYLCKDGEQATSLGRLGGNRGRLLLGPSRSSVLRHLSVRKLCETALTGGDTRVVGMAAAAAFSKERLALLETL